MDEVIPPNINRFGQNDHRRITPGAKSRQSKHPRLQFVLLKTTPLLIDPFLLTIDSLFLQNLLCQKQFPMRLITSSTATAVPLPLRGEGLSAVQLERDLQYRAMRQRFARRDSEGALPFAERYKIEECGAVPAPHSSVNSSLLTPHSSLSFSLSF